MARRSIMKKGTTTITIRDMKRPMVANIITDITTNTTRRVVRPRATSTDSVIRKRKKIKVMITMEITVNQKRKCKLLTTTRKPPTKSPKKSKHQKSCTRYTYTIPKRKRKEQCRWMVPKNDGLMEEMIAAMKKPFQMCDDVYLSLLLFLFTITVG